MFNIQPTEKAMSYLVRHAKGQAPSDELWQYQIHRATKRATQIEEFIGTRYEVNSMMDIGCGLGLIDVMLSKYLTLERIHLVDGDGTNPIQHDYQEHMQPWNDVHVAAELVFLNTDVRQIITHEPSPALRVDPLDLLVSFKSWGVHYPIGVYLNLARDCVKPGGLLIIDIRDERGEGDKNRQIEQVGFKYMKHLDKRVRAFVRL